MHIVTTTDHLRTACQDLALDDFVAVDTEFMRETTYWPQLCLIQVAGARQAVIVDPLAEGIDLEPFFALMANRAVRKVFHAARQDVEIVFQRSGVIPAPLFDTQIAAMVCGFGEQVGYENIVRKLAGARIDKTSRFTDWSRRPLSDKQLRYALADVTHLRTVYQKLDRELDRSGREHWLEEEMATLTSPETYRLDPAEAWRRLKFRARDKRTLAVFMEVAAWREREAQERNVPRNRIVKDDAMAEAAIHTPKSVNDIKGLRALPRGFAESRQAEGLMKAVQRGLAADLSAVPEIEEGFARGENGGSLGDILRLALKIVCQNEGVAAKLIASASDLDQIAADDHADVPALNGWRRELFGEIALGIKHGRLAVVFEDGEAQIIPREETAATPELEVVVGG